AVGSLRLPRRHWRFVALTGVCVFCVPYALVYVGETEVTSGLAAVLFSTLPLFSALLSRRLLPDEPLDRLKVVGIVLGIGGLAIVLHGGLALRASAAAVAAMTG